MSAVAAKVAGAARALVGTRFGLHGRGERLDCVGLAAAALAAGGWRGEVPTGYRLRGGDADRVAAVIGAGAIGAALTVVAEGWRAGDLLLVAAGPGQLHLLIVTDGGFVHADAGLGRVVERPGAVPWPVLGCWRMEG